MKQGAFFEQLVAIIQEHFLDKNDATITLNQRIKDLAGIDREIDVLIQYENKDNPRMIAFECKDYTNRPVDIEIIDAFDGKCALLKDITDKIIVSSSGFTKNAQISAKYRGIKLHSLQDIQDKNFFSDYDVFSPNVFYRIAHSDWNVTFMQDVPEEQIKCPAILKNFKDNKKINIRKYINHYLDIHLTQLCSEYIQNGRTPFETTIHIPLRNRIYIKDIYGQKLAIRFLDIPIRVDISFDTPDTLSQRLYCTEGLNSSTFVTKFGYKKSKMRIITIESDNEYSMYFKNQHGELVKPTTKEQNL